MSMTQPSARTSGKLVAVIALLIVILATGNVASAQTGTTTPGVPNTGAGGNAAQNLLLITSSALLALSGGMYLLQRRRA